MSQIDQDAVGFQARINALDDANPRGIDKERANGVQRLAYITKGK